MDGTQGFSFPIWKMKAWTKWIWISLPALTFSNSLNRPPELFCLGLTVILVKTRLLLWRPSIVFKHQELFNSNSPRIFFMSFVLERRFWKVAIIKIGSRGSLESHLSDNAGLAKVSVPPYGDSRSLTRFQGFYIQRGKKSSLWLVGFGTYFPPFPSTGLWVPSESTVTLPLSAPQGGPSSIWGALPLISTIRTPGPGTACFPVQDSFFF